LFNLLYEPFGLATIEAMSCGVPVVVTENGGGSEILSEKKKPLVCWLTPKITLPSLKGHCGYSPKRKPGYIIGTRDSPG
jgi:glycosyltransferase involved in cell wall biosynthesis